MKKTENKIAYRNMQSKLGIILENVDKGNITIESALASLTKCQINKKTLALGTLDTLLKNLL